MVINSMQRIAHTKIEHGIELPSDAFYSGVNYCFVSYNHIPASCYYKIMTTHFAIDGILNFKNI